MTERAAKGEGSRYFNGTTMAVIDVAGKTIFIVASILIAFVAYEGKNLLQATKDHERRLTQIEANRYTSNDALKDMRLVNRSVVDLRQWIEERYPPTWLREDVIELKLEVRELRLQMLKNKSSSLDSATTDPAIGLVDQ